MILQTYSPLVVFVTSSPGQKHIEQVTSHNGGLVIEKEITGKRYFTRESEKEED